jgi:transcriptional regulator with XRE-family HTH domain
MREPEHASDLLAPGLLLYALRRQARLSSRELASAANIAPNTIRNAERGSWPTAKTQDAIVDALSAALNEEITWDMLWPIELEPAQARGRLIDSEILELAKQYAEGATTAELAERHKLRVDTVRARLRSAGITLHRTRRRRVEPDEVAA